MRRNSTARVGPSWRMMRLRRSCIRVLRSPTRRSTSPWLRCWRTLLARPAGAGGSWDTGARWHRGLRGSCIIVFWVEGAGALWACIVEGFSGLQQLEEPETWLQHHCEGAHEGFWGLRQLEEPETKLHHHWDGAHNGLAQALAHVPSRGRDLGSGRPSSGSCQGRSSSRRPSATACGGLSATQALQRTVSYEKPAAEDATWPRGRRRPSLTISMRSGARSARSSRSTWRGGPDDRRGRLGFVAGAGEPGGAPS